jgi:hypothetical protein
MSEPPKPSVLLTAVLVMIFLAALGSFAHHLW